MESQLLAGSGTMHCVAGTSVVQTSLSNPNHQLTRQLILSNPQIQQQMQTTPQVEDMHNANVLTRVS